MTPTIAPYADAPPGHPEVWEEARLASLLNDVGEAGLRDLLRLFMADMPLLQQQFARATAAGDVTAARTVLAVVQDSAAALGLAALEQLVRCLDADPLAPGGSALLLQETARIRFVPTLKQAS